MSEQHRDELAQVIATELDTIFGNRIAEPAQQDTKLATALIAAGYRKPRTITTAEELDALPGGSIIRDVDGCGWQKYNRPLFNQPMWFSATRNDGFYFSSNFVDGNRTPATVLHEGEAA